MLTELPFASPGATLDVDKSGFHCMHSVLMRTEQETKNWEINNKSINKTCIKITKFENL